MKESEMDFPDAEVLGASVPKKGRKKRKDAILSHLAKAMELIHAERMSGAIVIGGERYQMWADWYNRVDDVRLEMAGVI